MTTPRKKDHRDDFISLCGVWSDEEMREFQKNTVCFSESGASHPCERPLDCCADA